MVCDADSRLAWLRRADLSMLQIDERATSPASSTEPGHAACGTFLRACGWKIDVT